MHKNLGILEFLRQNLEFLRKNLEFLRKNLEFPRQNLEFLIKNLEFPTFAQPLSHLAHIAGLLPHRQKQPPKSQLAPTLQAPL